MLPDDVSIDSLETQVESILRQGMLSICQPGFFVHGSSFIATRIPTTWRNWKHRQKYPHRFQIHTTYPLAKNL
jgi:hypothetical protein